MLFEHYSKYPVNFICPYCGRLFPMCDATIDHIMPKSEWGRIKQTKYFRKWHDSSEPTSGDWRNKIYSCRCCNRNKSNTIYVPNWDVCGNFRYWSKSDLMLYATYFYYWRKEFLYYFRNLADANKGYSDSAYERYISLISEIQEFIAEYEQRAKEDNWYIDNI